MIVALSLLGMWGPAVSAAGQGPADPLAAKLARVYRMDVSRIDVTYDFRPGADWISGRATLRFVMRPGQKRPFFHFNPLRYTSAEGRFLTSLKLDRERLNPRDSADLRRIRPAPSAEPGFEVRRKVSAGDEHVLRVRWRMPKPRSTPGWFAMNFDDTEGPKQETETLWPTVSSPEMQARHRITMRVHSPEPYRVIGSGRVRRESSRPGVQKWAIDTLRPVASHTVLFNAAPARALRVARFKASGVPVTIAATGPARRLARGKTITRRAIAGLIRDWGPFPVPQVQILLNGWDGGMEYYAATKTGLGALAHELGHMYFGVTAVNRTWRDTWIDESAVVWHLAHRWLPPVKPRFRSSIAVGRSVVAPGFDERAYGYGARVFESIARALGGDRKMIRFLADVHRRREFKPFTTQDFFDDVLAAQDKIGRRQLGRWLLGRK